MKAAVMTELRKPLEVLELPDPVPGPDGALVRVEACGICRSDWHLWRGDWTWMGIHPQLPLVMGHELAGVVEAVWSSVRDFRAGDRVTLPFHMACGHCEYCHTGRSNICLAHGVIGTHFNGGYGRLAAIPAADANMVRLPNDVDAVTAAALGCRYMTSYHALVDRAKLQPGEWVAVFGVGGVGLSAVQIAATLGAQVIAVDISEKKLRLAEAEGAAAVVDAHDQNTVEQVREITSGGADLAVDAVGASETALPALQSIRKGGRHLQIGLTGVKDRGALPLPVDVMLVQEISFIPSLGCPTSSYRGLLALVASGKLNPKRLVSRCLSVDQASEVIDSMTNYDTVGFNVISDW
jgi:alcohol dehydrogenase, propanol-preferring